jgi:hypothetical protein
MKMQKSKFTKDFIHLMIQIPDPYPLVKLQINFIPYTKLLMKTGKNIES